MNGKDRIMTALQHQEPDRVPIFEWSINPNVMEALTGSRSLWKFVETYDLDAVCVGLATRKNYVSGDTYYDDFGVLRKESDDYHVALKHVINQPSDLSRYKMPNPDDAYRYDNVRESIRIFGNDKAICVAIRDVFSFPRDMLGFENLFVNFYEEPELVDELSRMIVEFSSRVAANLKALGIQLVATQDDLATNRGLLISKEMFCKQLLPNYKRLVANLKAHGLIVFKHTDGDIREIIPEFIDSGIDCLDPIDPNGNMDMGDIKRQYGDCICLKGNIDCVCTLVSAGLDDVEKDVIQCIEDGAPGGGFILSSSNSIHGGIHPKNFEHMIVCAKKHGKYR